MGEGPREDPGLSGRAFTGVRWTAIGRLLSESSALIAIVLTSRLLTPTEVGHAALGFIVTALGGALTQQGFGSSIVRKRSLHDRDAATAHGLSVVTGFALGSLIALVAPLIAGSLGSQATHAIQLGALSFPVVALGAVPLALKQRDLAFKEIATIDTVASLVGAVTTVALAAAGVGPSSLVAGPLMVYGITSAVLLYTTRGVWGLPSAQRAAAILRFGTPVAAAGILYIASRNVTYGLLAARLPSAQLGFYFRAYQLGVDYQSKVSNIMLKLSLPLLSKATDREHLRAIRIRMSRLHAVALFPCLGLLAGTAPTLIPFVFGPEWAPAVEPTQLLTVAGVATVMATGTNSLLIAAGHPKAMLGYHVLEFVVYATTVSLLARHGLVPVCAGVAAANVAMLIVLQRGVVQPLVGISAYETLVVDARAPALACLPLLAVAFGGTWLGDAGHVPAFATLGTVGVVGVAVYGATLRACFPAAWADLIAVARRS